MNTWIELTEEEKNQFVDISNNTTNSTPTVFNLQSDKDDFGGKFAQMTREDVIAAAASSAKWLVSGIH